MSALMGFWNLILETNTFNFIVLVVIFVILIQKFNVAGVIEKLKTSIIDAIENAKQARATAESNFHDAKSKIEHIEDEIAEKITLASGQAENVAESIRQGVERKIHQIEVNATKVVEAEERTLFTTLTDNTSIASVEMARNKIISMLKSDSKLHDKYIEESIKELDWVEI